MNRSQAIEWCIKNINHWPRKDKGIVSSPKRWVWICVAGEKFLFMRDDVPICKADWVNPSKINNH